MPIFVSVMFRTLKKGSQAYREKGRSGVARGSRWHEKNRHLATPGKDFSGDADLDIFPLAVTVLAIRCTEVLLGVIIKFKGEQAVVGGVYEGLCVAGLLVEFCFLFQGSQEVPPAFLPGFVGKGAVTKSTH